MMNLIRFTSTSSMERTLIWTELVGKAVVGSTSIKTMNPFNVTLRQELLSMMMESERTERLEKLQWSFLVRGQLAAEPLLRNKKSLTGMVRLLKWSRSGFAIPIA